MLTSYTFFDMIEMIGGVTMYYIDFDNTLYETGRLTKEVLTTFSKIIGKAQSLNPNIVLDELKKSFNSSIDNFETFAGQLSEKFNVSPQVLQSHLKKIVLENGSNFVFPDALDFLKRLNKKGEKVCILTYVAQKKNLKQQSMKLAGSGILPYVDEIYNTTRLKFELEIDYKNGIFIDDSPRELEGLYKAGAKHIIRIKKPNNTKRTSQILRIKEEIPTYENFNDIKI